LAAGLLTVAHESGGPMMDIIEIAEGSRTGWLASDELDYARILFTLMKLPPKSRQVVRNAAR
jgi:alpha-1,2-mannosyltransferase